MIHNNIWLSNFYIHLFAGILAVLSGLFLFFNRLIPFKSVLHKKLGRIYVFAILFLSGPTGFYLSFFAEGGPIASIGFLLMSSIWMFITYKAVDKILKGDIEGHNKWMIRSYCFTLSGVTLRIMTPLGISLFGFDYQTNFIVTAYAPWLLNMVIAEVILFVNNKKTHESQTSLI